MKRGQKQLGVVLIVSLFVVLLMISFVSAGWFKDLFKIGDDSELEGELGSLKAGCVDSDDGINIFEKGIVTWYNIEYKDFCVGTAAVDEYYCKDNLLRIVYKKCDDGCVDGACVGGCVVDCSGKECGSDDCGGSCGECSDGESCDEGICVGEDKGCCIVDDEAKWRTPERCNDEQGEFKEEITTESECLALVVGCVDSDGGLDYYTAGEVTLNGRTEYDSCGDENLVGDRYCYINPNTGLEEIATGGYNCPHGCSDGACLPEETEENITVECTDSDGGKDYYTKGAVSGLNEAEVLGEEDYCTDQSGLYYLESEYLREYSCEDYLNYVYEDYNCPNGCSDGACLAEEPKENEIHISTCEELQAINEINPYNPIKFDENGKMVFPTFILDNDIDCSDTRNWNNGEGFRPIGWGDKVSCYCVDVYCSCEDSIEVIYSQSVFDGRGHVIKNLYINRDANTDVSYDGLVEDGVIRKGESKTFEGKTYGHNIGLFASGCEEIKDVGLVDVDITGNNNVGGLIGNGDMTITKITGCYVTGKVKGRGWDIGGLVGDGTQTVIINSYFDGVVEGSCDNYDPEQLSTCPGYEYRGFKCFTQSSVGGLIGDAGQYAFSNIINSYAKGKVIAPDCEQVGGLVGLTGVQTTISNSYFDGEVSGLKSVGGLVGFNEGFIKESFSKGSVKGEEAVGGFVGQNYPCGVGYRPCANIVKDQTGQIHNSYSQSEVSGSKKTGGFAGINTNKKSYALFSSKPKGIIDKSYSSGKVIDLSGLRGNAGCAGFVSESSKSQVLDCFWDKETSGKDWSAGGEGKTSLEMIERGTFSNWDFDSIWGIDNYPYLLFEEDSCAGASPKTCSELGKECSVWKEPCSGIVNCGACEPGKMCNADGQCVVYENKLIAHFKLINGEYQDLVGNRKVVNGVVEDDSSLDINKKGFSISVKGGYVSKGDSAPSFIERNRYRYYNYYLGNSLESLDGDLVLLYGSGHDPHLQFVQDPYYKDIKSAYRYKQSANKVSGSHYIGVMVDENDMRLYVDGIEQSGIYEDDEYNAVNEPAPRKGGLKISGEEIKIWNYALSDAEVEAEFEGEGMQGEGCVDSDNGKNYYVKGITSVETTSYNDKCSADILTEYSCRDNSVEESNYDCGSEGQLCEDGACLSEKTTSCSPVGLRESGKYCSTSETWKNQKGEEGVCENNFECESNFCIDDECIDAGLLRRLIEMLKELMGL